MRPTLKTLLPALAASLTLAACGSSSSTSTQTTTAAASTSAPASTGAAAASPATGAVKTASNSTLGASVLVDAQGFTVYHLSGERDGKFICTSAACEAEWHPVSASAVSAAVAGLTTVRRPDGIAQLAYKGTPLYTFAGDKAAGEANGQGIKDVGVWSAVTLGAGAPASASGESSGGGSSSGGGYGY